MSGTIRAKIFATAFTHLQAIHVSQDSQIPIELELDDYSIPTGAQVIAYARGHYASKTFQASCTYSGNVITLLPPNGFFVPGPNALQVEINGQIIPFQLTAICKSRISSGGYTTPEQVLPYVERAENASASAEQYARSAAGSAESASVSKNGAASSASAAAKSAEAAKNVLAETQSLVVRTPYIGSNGHWYIWSLSQEKFVDSGSESRGSAPTLDSYKYEYQVASNGTTVPTGAWAAERPVTPQGQYLWTRITSYWETGTVVWYSVDYRAIDGEQSVASEIGLRVVDGMLCVVYDDEEE